MATGILYSTRLPRTTAVRRNEHGDLVDADGHVVRSIGGHGYEITGLVMGGPDWKLSDRRGDVVSTEDLLGVPTASKYQPQHDDTLVIDGVRYKVHGPPQWAHRSGLTGRKPRYRWLKITATAN